MKSPQGTMTFFRVDHTPKPHATWWKGGKDGELTEFILLGITQNPQMKKPLCIVCFRPYLITQAGHTLISTAIFISTALASLRYFFLSCLSIIEGFYSSWIAPKMVLISENSTISFNGCMSQLFAEHFFGEVNIHTQSTSVPNFIKINAPLKRKWIESTKTIKMGDYNT